MEVKATIIVKGEVQKVGYRDYVQKIAKKLNVKGYIENLKDSNVKCEAKEDTLQEFIKQINVKKDLISVEEVNVVEIGSATGEYKYFNIKYGPLEEELGERLVAALNIATRQDIKDLRQDVQNMHQDLKQVLTICIKHE